MQLDCRSDSRRRICQIDRGSHEPKDYRVMLIWGNCARRAIRGDRSGEAAGSRCCSMRRRPQSAPPPSRADPLSLVGRLWTREDIEDYLVSVLCFSSGPGRRLAPKDAISSASVIRLLISCASAALIRSTLAADFAEAGLRLIVQAEQCENAANPACAARSALQSRTPQRSPRLQIRGPEAPPPAPSASPRAPWRSGRGRVWAAPQYLRRAAAGARMGRAKRVPPRYPGGACLHLRHSRQRLRGTALRARR